ncbi:MAG: LmeA family phospholipid-binding protein [Jatrophihabitans sp.]|uniref:LmeA family phospholipid-binding protein n=1 Tax=Jatrophihabitans sp. TaxID=1932789 RepID=UPI003F815FF7
MRKLVIVVVGLLALLVVVDRVGVGIAEDRAAQTLKSSQGLASTPSVDITGFPFLTQVAGKEFDEIDVTAHQVPLGSNGVTITADTLHVTMQQVGFDYGFKQVTVGHGTGTAVLTYRQLTSVLDQALPGVTLSYGGATDKVRASATVPGSFPVIGGRTVGLTLDPKLAGDAVNFGVSAVTGLPSGIAGFLLDQITSRLGDLVGKRIPLDEIPFQLRVADVSAQADGIAVRLTGDRLTFHRR